MSSTVASAEEAPELKGGHPPAVKAGGMRIARNRQSSTGESKEKTELTKEEQEQYGVSPPKTDKQVLVSGAITKEDKAFPPEAVKHFHEHPLPSKEMRPVQQKHNINQPK